MDFDNHFPVSNLVPLSAPVQHTPIISISESIFYAYPEHNISKKEVIMLPRFCLISCIISWTCKLEAWIYLLTYVGGKIKIIHNSASCIMFVNRNFCVMQNLPFQ